MTISRRKPWKKFELVTKSREAALSATQTFNNPHILFKSETFTILMIIAWTYLLHAHYRENKVEYRYFEQRGKRKRFLRTKHGAYKYWELERCLNDKTCPLELPVKENLRFLIGLRHEIEHQMTDRIDRSLARRFQACCINFHEAIVNLFGKKYGLAKHLSFSLQFSTFDSDQIETSNGRTQLPENVSRFISGFEDGLDLTIIGSQQYDYRVYFVPRTANRESQAAEVIEFVSPDSKEAKDLNRTRVITKQVEKPKLLPKEIVRIMNREGFDEFSIHRHTKLWQSNDAKDPKKNFGVRVGKQWYWYESWVTKVRQHCRREFCSTKDFESMV